MTTKKFLVKQVLMSTLTAGVLSFGFAFTACSADDDLSNEYSIDNSQEITAVDGEEGISLVAINGETTKKAAINNAADIDHYRVEFYSNGTDETTVGIFIESTTAKWVVFDNFKLFYLGTTPPIAVESINAATEKKATVIYNLAGQRVQKAVRGLYIINGKKVLVK